VAAQNQETGQTFLFEGHKIGKSSYFGADSSTKKKTINVEASALMMRTINELRPAP
jgi:hypothetical protein